MGDSPICCSVKMSADSGRGSVDFNLFTCSPSALIFSLTPLTRHLPPLLSPVILSSISNPPPPPRRRSPQVSVSQQKATFCHLPPLISLGASHPVLFFIVPVITSTFPPFASHPPSPPPLTFSPSSCPLSPPVSRGEERREAPA